MSHLPAIFSLKSVIMYGQANKRDVKTNNEVK
uniref:Uncharacterized protein n=1 Tax=Anguilla anguilla TaxID=7936 RepID=A0A0E9P983_ANGAN